MNSKFAKVVSSELFKRVSAKDEVEKAVKDAYEKATPIQKAYFDNLENVEKYPGVGLNKYRNLDWRSDEWLTVDEAIKAFESIEKDFAYNDFKPKLLKVLKKWGPEVKVQPARESSVCVYVSGIHEDGEDAEVVGEAVRADEAGFEGDILRLWWD